MPTIVGILAFISMINTTSKRLKARNVFISRNFGLYKQLKFHAQMELRVKKSFITPGPGHSRGPPMGLWEMGHLFQGNKGATPNLYRREK